MRLSGWGRFPAIDTRLVTARSRQQMRDLINGGASLIARGLGRAYGDAALNRQCCLSLKGMNRFLQFDAAAGRLTCEAGVTLAEVLRHFVPRGWFPAVVPGTKQVTIGGMVAADIHGKNHHINDTFGRSVESLELMQADGAIITCSRQTNQALFAATLGGMGLTGVIVSVTFRLRPVATAYLWEETQAASGLAETMRVIEQASQRPYVVAWIDGLSSALADGRALVITAEHASPETLPPALAAAPLEPHGERTVSVPPLAPAVARSRTLMRLANRRYHGRRSHGGRGERGRPRLTHYDPYFFPLDGIHNWNCLYGRQGFVQYQCVIPFAASRAALAGMSESLAGSGVATTLAVLKLMGPVGDGLLSFPLAGYTLAMDFPLSDRLGPALARLDQMVMAHGGRVYLAKDACSSHEVVARGYPHLAAFTDLRKATGAGRVFTSLLSERLSL
ncbi:MAG: FAD-binding oxidoreductase [Alphaproteobacteria bacterium]